MIREAKLFYKRTDYNAWEHVNDAHFLVYLSDYYGTISRGPEADAYGTGSPQKIQVESFEIWGSISEIRVVIMSCASRRINHQASELCASCRAGQVVLYAQIRNTLSV